MALDFGDSEEHAYGSSYQGFMEQLHRLDDLEKQHESSLTAHRKSEEKMEEGKHENHRLVGWSTWGITIFILTLGLATSGAFLGLGVVSALADQDEHFERSATDLVKKMKSAVEDYINAASFIHNRCRSREFSRRDFREIYEYLTAGGLDVLSVQYYPNITHDERPAGEAEALAFYAKNYPYVNYQGFVGFESDNATSLGPRSPQDFYFPIHFLEPVQGNEAVIGLDMYSSESRRQTILSCIDTGLPTLTDRLRLVQERGKAYGVVLMHPGINFTSPFGDDVATIWPRDIAGIVLRIPDLLQRFSVDQSESMAIYLYDQMDETTSRTGKPQFLGAVMVRPRDDQDAELVFLPEVELIEVRRNEQFYEENVSAANKVWTVVVVAVDETFDPVLRFVILGGIIIFAASVFIGIWVFKNARRTAKFNAQKAEAEAERAALILDSARQAAIAERELNDFIAHEVRNPVAAAMAACSFVKSAINNVSPLVETDSIQSVKDDVCVIDNSLSFVNDLLRNMLDMHRAANEQLKVDLIPTDILRDVLEPVEGMLYQRGGKLQVFVDCPENLIVMSDRLRLKQVVLNLGRNSSKFVEKGFIRLRAGVVNNFVQLSVEDSGSGIPLEKREHLFNKYQESLDVLSQGTVSLELGYVRLSH